MTWSRSPDGPWSTPVLVLRANHSTWDNRSVLVDTNLAVEIFEDGSAVGIWRKCENTPSLPQCVSECCTFPHLMTATSWRDPATYVAHSDSDGRLFPEVKPYGSEDPFVWREAVVDSKGAKRTVVHAVLHDEQGPARCTANGRHAFSDDPTNASSWRYGVVDAYDGTVVVSNGSNLTLYRRERPHLIITRSADGGATPTHLSNGVQERTTDDRSWTLVQALRPAAK